MPHPLPPWIEPQGAASASSNVDMAENVVFDHDDDQGSQGNSSHGNVQANMDLNVVPVDDPLHLSPAAQDF